MKLPKTLGWLALAGALVASTPAQAAETFSSSATFKLTATVQDVSGVDTSDGEVSSTIKVTIVNKDLLDAFEEWWGGSLDLPSGANLALDESYNLVIVDKDGDILFNVTDLEGFLELVYGSNITSSGRYREKDNGDYTDKYVDTYFIAILLLQEVIEERSADIDTDTDGAVLEGIDYYSWSDSYNADKNDYKFSSTDKANIQGTGVIEDSDAVISGDFKSKYNFKDDDSGS